MRKSLVLCAPIVALSLVACGGGGGGCTVADTSAGTGTGTTVSKNQPPIANAGASSTGFVGQAIKLDGAKSSDPESASITYKWVLKSKPVDSAVYFDDTESPTPVLSNVMPGVYVAELVVNDGVQDSVPASVSIQVEAITSAAPPRAPTTGEIGYMKDVILKVFPNYLRSPSSLKIINGPDWAYYDSIGQPTKGAFSITYDAANGFGAIVRGRVICPAEWGSTGVWKNTLGSDLRICVFL